MRLLTVFQSTVLGVMLLAVPAMAAAVKVHPPSNVADVALAAGMAPHRATYDIRLVSARNGSQIINVAGKMTYSWESSCEGWVTNHGFKIAYEYAENQPLRVESQFSTLESLNGQKMRFSSTRRNNGEVREKVSGSAVLGQGEKTGTATYDVPAATTLSLPVNTMFPMTHTLRILRQAKEGKPFLSRPLFDGSDVGGVTQVSAVIGKMRMLDMQKRPYWPKGWSQKMRAWPVTLAFFPQVEDEGGEADYDLQAQLLENGVMTEMTIAYKDFKVRHVLTKIESLPVVTCARPNSKTTLLPQKTLKK